jgi:hypothetical protein
MFLTLQLKDLKASAQQRKQITSAKRQPGDERKSLSTIHLRGS